MKHAQHIVPPADRERITQAVVRAEAKTSAEIVPVLALSSGRYDRGEDLCGLCLGIAALATTWLLLPATVDDHGSWQDPPWAHLAALVGAMLAGFAVGTAVASRWGALKMLFTPRRESAEEVEARARQTFFDQRVHHTDGNSGVLLYVSLLERRAAVLVDESIRTAVGQATIDSLCSYLTRRLAGGSLGAAFTETIDQVGELLGPKLPRTTDDRNELSDALTILEGR